MCGLMEVKLLWMFVVLCECGVFVCILFEVDVLWGVL